MLRSKLFLFAGAVLLLAGCAREEKAIADQAVKDHESLAREEQILWEGEDLFDLSVEYFSQGEIDDSYTIPEGKEPMEVIDWGPTGDLPGENSRPVIYGALTQPAVPLSALGGVITEYEGMDISPAVSGVYRWYGSRLISFEPDETLLTEQEYTVTFKAGLSSLGGKKLKKDHSFTFNTELLEIVALYPGTPLEPWQGELEEVPPALAKTLTVTFNHPVDRDILASQLHVVSSKGGSYTFTASYPEDPEDELPPVFKERTLVLKLDKEPPAMDTLSVVVPEGTNSRTGSVGTREDQAAQLATLSAFRFIEYDDYNWRFPREGDEDVRPVYLEFSHPVDPESVLENLKVSMDVENLADHVAVWDKYIRINNLPVEYDSVYNITFMGGIKDIYGRELGSDRRLAVEVGPATSYFYMPHLGYRFLEANFPPRVVFEYQNLAGGQWHIKKTSDPYRKINERELTTPFDLSNQERNRREFELIDLEPYLNSEGYGAVAMAWKLNREDDRYGPYQKDLVLQVTDIGVTMRFAYNKVLVWVASLSTGEPVARVPVNLLNVTSPRFSGETNEEGLAVFDLEPKEFVSSFYDSKGYLQLRAEVINGEDRAVFKPNGSHSPYPFGVWGRYNVSSVETPRPFTFLFCDRGLYKPGETVTFKGIDRNLVLGEWEPYRGRYTLSIRENVWRSEPVMSVTGEAGERGSFDGTFRVDEDLPPGNYLMEYTRLEGENARDVIRQVDFMVENFRRAGFQVTVDKPLKEVLPGEKISFPVKASYLAGGTLAGAPYKARWTREPMRFSPGDAAYDDYNFGPADWENSRFLGSSEGNLDSSGQASLTEKVEPDDGSGRTYLYRVEATVEDPSRQEIAGRGFSVVHPAPYYVGARVKNGTDTWWTRFVAAGEEATADMALVTPEGEPFDGDSLEITARLSRKEWVVARQRGISGRISNNWEQEIIPVSTENLDVKGDRFSWNFTPDKAGYYQLEISAKDDKGHTARTDISLYASGSQWVKWQNRNPENIEIVTDRDLYNPGDTARLMVQSPLEKGRYLLTIEREGILEDRILELEGSASVIDIPIEEDWVPIMYVSLASYTARTEDPPSTYGEPDLGKPRGCYGLAKLNISTDTRLLDVEISMDKGLYAPGEEGACEITVTRDGKPVEDSEVTLLAVDRGVLDLIGYHVPDPISYFYNRNNYVYGVHGGDSRADLIDPVTYELKDLYGGDGEEEDDKLSRRKDFSPLAVFMPSLITDSKGKVTAEFTFPDTLTTYRFTALAMESDRFGRREEEVPVQNPLTVRTAIPPVLRVRDTAFCGLFVTNLTDKAVDLTAELELEEDLVTVNGRNLREMKVKPGETKEIRYPLQALAAGETRAVFTVRSDILSEIVEQTFTVEKPLVDETFTIVGQVEPEGESAQAGEGLVIPSNIARGYGSLSLALSSSLFANLSETLSYFINYPYNITLDNQLMQALPQLVLGDKLETLASESNDPDRVRKLFQSAAGHQESDGGLSFVVSPWIHSSPWLSIRFLHFLSFHLNRGGEYTPLDREALVTYVRKTSLDKDISSELRLYALYALSLAEGPAQGNRTVLIMVEEEEDRLGLSGYLLASLALDRSDPKGAAVYLRLKERINNLVKVGTRSLDITDTYEHRSYFDSQVQDLALLYLFYSREESQAHLARMASYTLVSRQEHGRWKKLNDTLWAFASLARDIEETGDTDLTARISAGDLTLLEADFDRADGQAGAIPETWEESLFEEPLETLPRDSMIPLAVTAEGRGTAYYTASMNYALPLEVIGPRDEGFSLFTEIQDLDGKVIAPDKLKLGDTYRMRAVLSSSKRRSQVVMTIPVPSGTEILNAAFETTSDYAGEGGVDGESWTRETYYGEEETTIAEGYGLFAGDGFYFSAFPQEKRIGINRVSYAFSDFYRGSREVSFLFRPYCPGIFPVPPAQAECLYEEEIFGRSGGSLYVVE